MSIWCVRANYKWILFITLISPLVVCTSCHKKGLSSYLNQQYWYHQIQSNPKYELHTRIVQLQDGNLTTVLLNDQTNNYFYPASTVKLLTCLAALEKINQLPKINIHSTYYIEADTAPHSIARDLELIFAISDNAANNRLFDFVGRDAINAMMQRCGLQHTRIAHRLSSARSADARGLPIRFVDAQNQTIGTIQIQDGPISPLPPGLVKLQKGKGYYRNGQLVHAPMDFSEKNVYPLVDVMGVFERIFTPTNFPADQQFNIAADDLDFLKEAMKKYPYELAVDRAVYYDGYVKFLYLGTDTLAPIDAPDIYSKSGEAYGFISDGAFISDPVHNLHYFISAVLLVNEDGIFNDDQYEYTQIGIPFLSQFGKTVHSYLINQSEAKK